MSSGTLSLMSVAQLAAAMASGCDAPPLVLDVATSPARCARCIPGAVHFDLSCIDACHIGDDGAPLRTSGNFSLLPPAALKAALEEHGVEMGRLVVIYTQARRAGGLDLTPAARLAWCLSYCGVQHVALLAGGMAAWLADGHSVNSGHAAALPVSEFLADAALPFPLRPEYCADTGDVAATVSGNDGTQLADVRSWTEYSGGPHDYGYPLPLGRLPGAVWAHWGESTYVAGELYEHSSGALHALPDIAALWRAGGLRLHGARVVFYCGSGWRSAVAWCICRLLAHDDCASYDGGLHEWAYVDARPLTCDAPCAAATRAESAGRARATSDG
jgi:thiosulfate/3-mercaptopyruvate sulfurtransferase